MFLERSRAGILLSVSADEGLEDHEGTVSIGSLAVQKQELADLVNRLVVVSMA